MSTHDFVRGYRAVFGPGSGLVAVLHGFFDDTNTHGEPGKPTAVAGFLFELADLERLTDEWRGLSADLERPFRAADCYHGNGQFKTWPTERRRALQANLAALIGETRGTGFYAAVDPADFRAVVERSPSIEKHLGSPFALCMLVCAQMIGDHLRKVGDDRSVSYWFEAGSPGQTIAAELMGMGYDRLTLRDRYRINSYAFIEKGAVALVAADFLAWEMQRSFRNDAWTERLSLLMKEGAKPILVQQLNRTEIEIWAMVNDFYSFPPRPTPGGDA